MHCSVLNCKNKLKFKFPTNAEVRGKWLEAIRRPDFKPNPSHGLCIQHFDPNDILKESMAGGMKSVLLAIIPSCYKKYNNTSMECLILQATHYKN